MMQQQFDHIFQTKLSSWIPFRSGYHSFFDPNEINTLHASDNTFDLNNRTVALMAFENEYASLGGLAVVTRYLPRVLKQSGARVVFFTPFHINNKAIREAAAAGHFAEIFRSVATITGVSREVTCYQDSTADISSYFVKIDGLFDAEEDPYHYSDPVNLLFDSLGFCAAVPLICAGIGLTKDIMFHGHDWECAAIAYTCRRAICDGVLHSAKSVLTLHNSYDAPFPAETALCYCGKKIDAHTVLQAFLPLLSGPLTSVSTPFAHELCNDPLQRGVFTGHLQKVFGQNPPIGIENGVFGDKALSFFGTDPVEKTMLTPAKILAQKEKWHTEFRSIVSEYRDNRIIGNLTFPQTKSRVPVFFMSGRFDILQKGFDTLFWAFQRLPRGSAKLLFSPTLTMGSEKNSDMAFFVDMVQRCKGDIALWPFRIKQQEYATIVRGASFLVMPSLYEPFGSATEGIASGTPVIARATGGLWVQVESAHPVTPPQFYGSVLSRSPADPRDVTGILYREEYPLASSEIEWARLCALPVSRRERSPLFESIVQAAHTALENAVELYKDRAAYSSMITCGLNSLETFDWNFAIAKYRKVYDMASRSAV
jgi:glycogen synthase